MRDLIEFIQTNYPGQTDLEGVLKILCPHGIVIGGTYRHFKGEEYKVLGFTNDASDPTFIACVRYVATKDARDECTRQIDDFLADVDKPEYRGPRFKLVSVS